MTNEVRDRLAELEGWMVEDTDVRPGRGPAQVWRNKDGGWIPLESHPIPDDLNTCAAMWDKHAGEHGWRQFKWAKIIGGKAGYAMIAENHSDHGPGKSLSVWCSGHDAASELRDRWALLGEVLKARGVW